MNFDVTPYERKYGLPSGILNAVMRQESGGNPNAVSPKGAQGLFQIMPDTARDLGVDPLDPNQAADGAARYLAQNYKKFGKWDLALAAYNAGPGNVEKYGGVPPFPETQNYVSKVMPGGVQVASNDMNGWRGRATPVTSDASSGGSWRSRAEPVAAQPDWRSRAAAAPVQEAPSVAEDVTKTVASNLIKGGVDAAMILPNLVNQAVAGPQYLVKGVSDTFKGNPTDRNFQPWQPFFSSEDLVSNSAIDYTPQTTAGKVAEIPARLAGNIVGPKAINAAGNKVFPGERPTAAERQVISKNNYDKVDNSGAVLDDQVFADFSNKAQNIRPQGRIQQAMETRDAFDDALETVQKVSSVKNMTIKEVQELDEKLTNMAEAARGNMGVSTPESRLINQLKHGWRSAVEEAGNKGQVKVLDKNGQLKADPQAVKDWQNAIKDYAVSRRSREIELIVERAKLTDNPASSIKTQMRNLYIKIQQGKVKGYSKEQTQAIKEAAETGLATGIARAVGSRLNPIMFASNMGLDAGLTAGAVAKASRDLATRNQSKRAEKVLELLLGAPTKDAQATAWATRNQGAARKATTSNLAGQLMAPSKEKKK